LEAGEGGALVGEVEMSDYRGGEGEGGIGIQYGLEGLAVGLFEGEIVGEEEGTATWVVMEKKKNLKDWEFFCLNEV
jgi:hypothetical protein